MNKILIIGFIILGFTLSNKAQHHEVSKSIDWTMEQYIVTERNNEIQMYEGIYSPSENFTNAKGLFNSITFKPVSEKEQEWLSHLDLNSKIILNITVAYERKKPVIHYSFLPYRINPENNKIEKVDQYKIFFTLQNSTLKSLVSRTYASRSLLADGNWYKIKVDTSGVFKLTYAQLIQIGLTKPENVRLYSYGGKQLSYSNSDFSYDDLVEIPIKMNKGSDESFNDGDDIIFYAEGSTSWEYNSGLDMFLHKKHNFSNYTYLFISDFEGAGGLKFEEVDNGNLTANYTSSSYDSYKCHEINKYNLIESGRIWYGEKFKPGNDETFSFAFPNIISSEKAKIYTSVAGRKQISGQSCYFNISENGINLSKIEITGTYSNYTYGHEYKRLLEINNPNQSINLKYSFEGVNSNMEGYLDFVCINTREELKIHGSQFMFRDKKSMAQANISKFDIDNTGKEITVWNITDAVKPYELKLTVQNNTSSFKITTDTIEQFIAFDGANYYTPIIEGEDLGLVENQNLHGKGFYDMVILTHPKFQEQAEELAKIHMEKDNLSVLVTQPQTIYNEFSSGTPDITAIRNFMRMLYDKATTDDEMPKYLLLFGDGSYDNWNTGEENTNLIPTYQSINSLSETISHVSDDYFGLLDLGEGEIMLDVLKIYGKLDISIGRFPVVSVEEAELMVAKIKHYMSPQSFGDWRTKLCFIGDDDDGGTHMNDADKIAENIIRANHPEYNNDKVYLDAYKQVSTPSGQRFPDVTKAINEKVEQGALIIDYVGHGNPRILAHEEILSVTDVRSWKNWDKLSVFVTASCEVGRFDDYQRLSFGEWLVLSPNGGGIAAITTTRVVYSGSNFNLSKAIFNNILNKDLRLGDIIRIAKNNMSPSGTNHRNFSLLGDPALRLAVPRNEIVIGIINENFLAINTENSLMQSESFDPVESYTKYEPGDTLYALSKAKVEGFINDENGEPFNKDGVLNITIYDKTDTLYTYGQDNSPMQFTIQDKILYKGKASIIQGVFSFEFIVPKDINYKFGPGKISLYAVLDSAEAIGYSENIIIGGNAKSISDDYNGPEIELYMNDTLFTNGGTTNENPILFAKLKDNTGINTTGNGFGHNITAILDGNQDNIYILNNYYIGDMDEYNSGEVRYPFSDLSAGHHHIAFKTFDVYNNSSESEIEFYVYEGNSLIIDKMYNTPNPFYDETEFRFEHNQSFDVFDIKIDIYDIMGNKVTELNQKNSNGGYAITPIVWNGTNSAGAKLPKGVYIYRTEITATDGRKTYKSSKLMIFK